MPYALLIMNRDSEVVKIVSVLLTACNHQVLHKGRFLDSLMAIWNRKDTLEPVLFTNINRIGTCQGNQLLRMMRKVFGFDIVQMAPDKAEFSCRRGVTIQCSAYVLNVSSLDQMNLLWDFGNGRTCRLPSLKNSIANSELSPGIGGIRLRDEVPKRLPQNSSDPIRVSNDCPRNATSGKEASKSSSLHQPNYINAYTKEIEDSYSLSFWLDVYKYAEALQP